MAWHVAVAIAYGLTWVTRALEAIRNYIVNHHIVSLGRLRRRSPAELFAEIMQVCRKGWGATWGNVWVCIFDRHRPARRMSLLEARESDLVMELKQQEKQKKN